jgi:RNA polymerase sigma-70 factor (ECF subfamily)
MQAPGDESALITRAQRGDKIAIGMLYSNHVQAIYKYVRYRVDTDGLAEDITSEVFLRMVRQLPRYTYTGAPFSAWLYRIAANCITDAFRGQYAHVVEELPDEVADDQPDPLDTLTLAEDHDQLRQALQTLSPDYQNILILRFMNDVSHAEVAAAMDRTEAAVRVLQHRALKALADALRSIQQGRAQ